MRKTLITLSALLSTVALAAPASAAVTVFTDQTSFLAALAGTTLEDFEDAVLAPGLSISSPSGTITGGVFSDLISAPGSTTFNFASPIIAFGGLFDLAGPGGPGTGLAITMVPGGDLGTEIPRTISGGFFGFISTDGINSVSLTNGTQSAGQETYTLDNLIFADATAVPEPGTWALSILGFGVIGAAMRRRQSRAPSFA